MHNECSRCFLQQFLLQYCIALASFTGRSQILPCSRGEKFPIFLHGCNIKSGSGVMYLQPMILAALHSMMLACKFFHSKVVWYSLTRALAHPPLTWSILVLSSWLLVLVSLTFSIGLFVPRGGRTSFVYHMTFRSLIAFLSQLSTLNYPSPLPC